MNVDSTKLNPKKKAAQPTKPANLRAPTRGSRHVQQRPENPRRSEIFLQPDFTIFRSKTRVRRRSTPVLFLPQFSHDFDQNLRRSTQLVWGVENTETQPDGAFDFGFC
jgi:hypothetical protein